MRCDVTSVLCSVLMYVYVGRALSYFTEEFGLCGGGLVDCINES